MKAFARIRIHLTLTLTSALRISSGQVAFLPHPKNEEKEIEYALVYRDVLGKPYLPSTSLRGLLRAAAQDISDPEQQQTLNTLFGSANLDDSGNHSRIRVYDARAKTAHTRITTHNKINPITATAEDKLLFKSESVDPGTAFTLTIELDDVSEAEKLTIIDLLLLFSETNPFQLGSGANKRLGEFTLNIDKIETLSQDDVYYWLQQKDCTELPYQPADLPQQTHATFKQQGLIKIPFSLYLKSPLLIAAESERKTSNNEEADPIKFKQRDGYPYIPASTLLGVFRSRCRHIISSLALSQQETDPEPATALKCLTETTDALIDSLFGNTQRKSYIAISEGSSDLPMSACTHKQSFNAIDRFTGEVKDSALFFAEACYGNCFNFNMHINSSALQAQNNGALLILFYALKDFTEGLIPLGWGANKGFGQVHLTAPTTHQIEAIDWSAMSRYLQTHQLDLEPKQLEQWQQQLSEQLTATEEV
ncbi:RAMP superfamily CRISPR-associated protein [Bacterioplanoides sp.]|uniref:RAMP superfamily CRISPR-associated protein n=1 Tax=Bacterioplanoides sp. TaxID=2066072 RepID=UPI003B5A3603